MSRGDRPVMDVVFLSKANTPALQEMTQHAIDTCVAGTSSLLNIIVIEQVDHVRYDRAFTITMPGEFAYNAFANRGAAMGSAPWIMVANNDLIFEPGWLAPLLDAGNPVVSPLSPGEGRQDGLTGNTKGDQIGRHFSGWCFAITRDLWERIGGFDEDFTFWCADDAVIQQVKALCVQPMVVPASRVTHLGSITHKSSPDPTGERTWAQVWKFEQKYKVPKFQHSRAYARWKYAQKSQRQMAQQRARMLRQGIRPRI